MEFKKRSYSKRAGIHGLSKHKIYKTLQRMKGRCYNPRDKRYPEWGGRGITICDEWLDKDTGFLEFYNWSLDNGYEEHLSIDRYPDNDGNYEPSNCRWATGKEQSNNRSSNRLVKFKGEVLTLMEAVNKYSQLNYDTVNARINRSGWGLEKALLKPLRKRG